MNHTKNRKKGKLQGKETIFKLKDDHHVEKPIQKTI